jgi:hypothetical protein
MLMVPEARTAILRIGIMVAVAIICIVGAVRTDRRWVRILLVVVAVPMTSFVVFGIFLVSLTLQYGPR